MNRINKADFSLAAQRVLSALGKFEPCWTLSGRAALWWLPGVPRPIAQLDLVWHGRDHLGTLTREVLRTLAAASLDSAKLGGDARRACLASCDDESICLVRLKAEAAPPLEPPWPARLYGGSFRVERLREVLTTILVSLYERPDVQDLEDAVLLLRSGLSLERGLRDARCRNSQLSPQELAVRLTRFEVQDPESSEVSRLKLRRLQKYLACEILKQSAPDSRAS